MGTVAGAGGMTTPLAEMVRVMLERDVPRDVIVTAIEAAERHALRNVTNHDAKLKAAERAKRYRDKKRRDEAVAPSRDAPDAHILTSSSLPESQEHSEEKKVRNTKRKKNENVTLPDDWMPDREYCKSLGWNDQHTDREAQRFRDSAISKERKYAGARGWAAAWRNWCTSPFQQAPPGLNGTAPRPGSKDDTRERTVNALRSLDPFPRDDDAQRSEGTGPPIPRQLSLVKPA